ncbi:MAG: hypothetical protein EOS63_16030, partial [Mesorhizobium sp.]
NRRTPKRNGSNFGIRTLGCVDIQVMPACEWQLPALPVLTYFSTLRSVLGIHHSRLGLTCSTHPCGAACGLTIPSSSAR